MLEPGDSLVVYSDGVVKCGHPGEEELGLDRLMAAWPQARQQPAQGALMMLLAGVEELPPMSDDLRLTRSTAKQTNSPDVNEHGK
jgi:serine phosphatase RsbU (regulator of sigma subunit)